MTAAAVQRSDTLVHQDQGPTTRLRAQQTLARMREIVRQELALPLVWETARNIIHTVTPRDEVAQAQAVRQWCSEHFQFVNDPWDVQLLTSPTYVLKKIASDHTALGNCADAAMLTAALAMAVHLRCRFIAVAFGSKTAPYAHVFTVAYPRTSIGGTAAAEMDITRPPNLQRATFTRRLIVDV